MHIHYSKLLYSISDTNAHEVKTCQFKKIKRSLIYCKFNLNIVQTTLNVSLPASKHPVLLLLSNVMVSTLGEFCPSGLLHATATNANTKQLKKSAQRSKQCFFLNTTCVSQDNFLPHTLKNRASLLLHCGDCTSLDGLREKLISLEQCLLIQGYSAHSL